ncbi:hypothetical protein C8K36_11098 [Rhodococcus sp. OK519]|nr:hypothetical protein C8K36_11098 [Rhodococcus sp. OK519]
MPSNVRSWSGWWGWRSRCSEQRLVRVGVIAKERGRKPSLPPGTVEKVLRLTREELPADGSTHWFKGLTDKRLRRGVFTSVVARSLLSELRKIRILPVVRDASDVVAEAIAHDRPHRFKRYTGSNEQKSDHTPPDQE